MEQTQTIPATPKFFLWYFQSITKAFQIVWLLVLKNLDYFSIPILLKTLLAPWKRDIINTQGMTLNERFRVWVFNLISRLVGAVIRLFTIFFGLFLTLFIMVFGLAAAVVWILLPFLILVGLIYGITLIFRG